MLKRGDRERPEDQVLMRALRDFNVPKIVADDTPVFLGLISDLFPNLDVPRKRDQEFEKAVKNAACDLKLQPEENFIMKIVQLEEILFVRHSVFVVGDAGTGKTQTWRTLFRTYQNLKKKPVYADLNPKVDFYGLRKYRMEDTDLDNGTFSLVTEYQTDYDYNPIIYELHHATCMSCHPSHKTPFLWGSSIF